MLKAATLAHYVVDKCTRDGRPVSNLQLQKIMYFLQSVFCRVSSGELLFLDSFEAWPYGPVLSDVYSEYSSFGGRVIEMRYQNVESVLDDNPALKKFIDDGIEDLRTKYPWDLVRLSHAQDSPWACIYDGGRGYKNLIPNNLIIEAAHKKGGLDGGAQRN